MIIAGVAVWARRPDAFSGEASDNPDSNPDFTLRRAVLLFGPQMNDPRCSAQRTELKRILGPLLEGGYRIVEVYGTNAPTQNGEVYDWLDNQLLRDTLNARSGFHLIFVDDAGQMLFHAAQSVTAEALLHIFDLWHHIEGAAGEALAETMAEALAETGTRENEASAETVPLTAEPERTRPETVPSFATRAAMAQARKTSLRPATVTFTGPGLASQLRTLEMIAAENNRKGVPDAANEPRDQGRPEPSAATAQKQRPRAPSHIKEMLKRRRA
nr:hypothetical protein GCM10011355_33600 [Aquisalinus luteolus]